MILRYGQRQSKPKSHAMAIWLQVPTNLHVQLSYSPLRKDSPSQPTVTHFERYLRWAHIQHVFLSGSLAGKREMKARKATPISLFGLFQTCFEERLALCR